MISSTPSYHRVSMTQRYNTILTNKQNDVTDIQNLIKDITSKIFQKELTETTRGLEVKKKECEETLKTLNGLFYQDQKSLLKQAWDKMVNFVNITLGITIGTRNELDNIKRDLRDSKGAVDLYLKLETLRDSIQTRLLQIVAALKTKPTAALFEKTRTEQVEQLQARQKELCGNYYEDPQSLLDQAWRIYQSAIQANDSNAGQLFNTFNRLDVERRSNDAKLFSLEQQISCIVPSSNDNIKTYNCSIQEQMIKLKEENRS